MNYQTLEFLTSGESKINSLLMSGGVLSFLLGSCSVAIAQISADDSVPTQVDRTDNVVEITGGVTRGSNLFHSFQEFSVPQGDTAFFNNSQSVGNIISRVTGGSISQIDGLIRANGNANLILLNPSGINFGANARLDIGGSFLGSTADRLVFEDGSVFSASNTDSALLTVSVPVGLQLGQNSAAIAVTGTGHDLSLETPVFSPLTRGEAKGLEVKPGRALTLIGNGISFQGGILTAESGNISLGSVSEGSVGLILSDRGWTPDYSKVGVFNDLNLEQKTALDTSGISNGAIALQGRQIALGGGSVVLSQNFGGAVGGDISVNATDLTLVGAEPTGVIASGLYSETLSDVSGADINISTGQLTIEAGASIISTTSGSAKGGNVSINASESLQFIGFSDLNSSLLSVASVQTFGSGTAGDISVATKDFTALDGANISSVTGSPLGTGSGGNVRVTASESISLIGASPLNFSPSQITAGSGSPGNAGNVAIETARLVVRDGARVDASATASGSAGNLTIAASESVEVEGTFPGSINPSLITASANILDPALRSLFGLPDLPSGDSGNITLNTPQLLVAERGEITVRNDGTGDAGNLSVTADAVELNNEGSITAVVRQGAGGAIELDVADTLSLKNQGQIVSDNLGMGDGGQIAIAANNLNISDRAFISTTAFNSGSGGDIVLNITEAVTITGTGFQEFQQAQLSLLDGSLQSLKAETKGTGIFMGTIADSRSGELRLDTSSLTLEEGAVISSPIFTDGIGGNIAIATDSLSMSGSGIQIIAGSDSTSLAAGGNIDVETNQLTIKGSGVIANVTFGDADGGDININAQEAIALTDSPDNSIIFSGIYSSTGLGTGDAGTITLTTDSLYLNDGLISSNTGVFIGDGGVGFAGEGAGGDIVIEVAEEIEILGPPGDLRFVTGINSSTFAKGTAGDIRISADKLTVRDGLQIAATATASGNGGNLTIDANSIELVGTTAVDNVTLGGLSATSGRGTFGQPPGSGSAGNIEITAENLSILNGASVDVQSLGTGSAGDLNIEAIDSIFLDDRGSISAGTNSGTGGNINLTADNILWLGESNATATARGNADGGNINLQANNLVVLEGSGLTADASFGRGGNINLETTGLFICGECQISASSELGIDGIVNITTLDPNPDLEVVDVPIQLTQPEEAVVLGCSATANDNSSSLTISGRGGLAPRPSDILNSKAIAEFPTTPAPNERVREGVQLPPPARSWYVNRQGAVVLSALPNANRPQFNSDCHVD